MPIAAKSQPTNCLATDNQALKPAPIQLVRLLTACLLCTLFVSIFSGCVRRRLFVNSNPVGALVYVDNEQIGTTPCAVDFTYYGTREIRLIKPGFETLTFNQPIPTPWYEIPPLDFVSENLVPNNIRDNRSVTYNMVPQVIVPQQELIDRGNQLRQETLQSAVIPATAIQPVGPLIPTTAPTFSPSFSPPPNIVVPSGPTPAPVVLPPPGPQVPLAPPPSTQFLPPTNGPAGPQRGRPLVSPPLR